VGCFVNQCWDICAKFKPGSSQSFQIWFQARRRIGVRQASSLLRAIRLASAGPGGRCLFLPSAQGRFLRKGSTAEKHPLPRRAIEHEARWENPLQGSGLPSMATAGQVGLNCRMQRGGRGCCAGLAQPQPAVREG